ncbi:glycosyltransferase family 2 protein [Pelistega sp. NLN82]|uniref:Glycosyltransferase family 2 protein n=1 Tax=Pelistega ratti TaxID=2652177 RepID=A0A6L9Y449_9BURK|nr:glycosyltransferase family 2 protein [Pelistega ratti]NEN75093.1 glycosyltransferase family 2 protein [Pelistega ratti]
MPSLSVAMIVKNEEQDLTACLDTVKDWVDEIIIVDSGSTDNTPHIAQKYGAKFYVHTDWQGFGKQRQLAQQYVTSDYVLWLDADERITDTLKKSIQNILQKEEKNTIYALPRQSEVFGKMIYHSGWYPDYVIRLYKTTDTHYSDALVHESVIIPSGFQVVKLQGTLLHYTYKNLHHYLIKSANYAKAWADQREQLGKKASLFNASIHAIACFFKMYLLKKGVLDGKHGFLLAILSAHSTFIKYADLWIRNQKKY